MGIERILVIGKRHRNEFKRKKTKQVREIDKKQNWLRV